MGFAPTWLRQVIPLLHKTTLTTGYGVSKTMLIDFETTTYLIANYTCVLLILLLM